jgi:4-hydroxy-3-methylbut-2-enyl diphosphate reductase
LVHNPLVLERLDARGFRQAVEHDRAAPPETPAVLITAHGISDAARDRLLGAGKQIIDTTCPLVRRVHAAARHLAAAGFHVLVVGKQGHVEVLGIVEDLASCDVIGSPAEVRAYPHARLGIVCQTTASPELAQEICGHIQLHNPLAEIRLIDTICEPTRLRQWAMHALVRQVDAVVVVGGRNSNNTAQLATFCREHDKPVLQVQTATELDRAWLLPYGTVGLTAGTSTLPETVDQVHRALLAISR